MHNIIHTIRVIDKTANRCHVIARAKAASAAADYYEVEQWRVKGDDPTAEHGTYISGYTTQTI